MPNPFLRVQHNTSKTNVERPRAIDPVLEEVEGDNIPYRGINQDHGVPTNARPDLEPDAYVVDVTGHAKPAHVYEAPDKLVEPVPVRIVHDENDTGREYRTWWTDRLTVQDARQILGRDDNRVVVKLVNTDAAKTIWVGSKLEDLAMRGFPLMPGKELIVTGEMPVCVMSADGTQLVTTLGVYVETVVQER